MTNSVTRAGKSGERGARLKSVEGGRGAPVIHEEVYERLRRAIIAGQFEPGKSLSVRGLAAEFGVSAMPAREAIRRLAGATMASGSEAISAELISVAEMGEAEGFQRDEWGLRGFRTEVWNGFVFVNLDGELRVELLDETGKVLAKSRTMSGDSTRQRIEWEGRGDLFESAGHPVRFRFQLGRGALYSFWVTEDPKGASGGYLGAGGPGFDGVRDLPAAR